MPRRAFLPPSRRVNPRRPQQLTPVRVMFVAPNAAAGYKYWKCPQSGYYDVYAWGWGGYGAASASSYAGGSGALAVVKRHGLRRGEQVGVFVPALGSTVGDTTVLLPRRASLVIASRGANAGNSPALGGTAFGGDVNISGSTGVLYSSTANAGGGTDGGAAGYGGAPGAPGYDGFRGGDGAGSVSHPAGTPGGGGRSGSPADPQRIGGAGLVIITRVA